MNPYISQLNVYLSENPPFLSEKGRPTILEFLQTVYTELNPVDNEKIRESFRVLHDEFGDLLFERWERLFETVSEICFSYEEEAFMSGLLLGANLIRELWDNFGTCQPSARIARSE